MARLGAFMALAITLANVDQDPRHHMGELSHSEVNANEIYMFNPLF